MKKVIFLIPLFFIHCSSPAQEAQKLPLDEVDQQQQNLVLKLADETLSRWNKEDFSEFSSDISTPEFKKQFSTSVQKNAWQQISGMFGQYKAVKLEQVYELGNQQLKIYRLKGSFDKGNPEVRMVLNQNDQLAGMFIKPWQDNLN